MVSFALQAYAAAHWVSCRLCGRFPQLSDALESPTATVLTGGRPQSPDDMPVISSTSVANLFVNAGHGQYGWRLACGSAAVLEAVISRADAPPAAPLGIKQTLSLSRFATYTYR